MFVTGGAADIEHARSVLKTSGLRSFDGSCAADGVQLQGRRLIGVAFPAVNAWNAGLQAWNATMAATKFTGPEAIDHAVADESPIEQGHRPSSAFTGEPPKRLGTYCSTRRQSHRHPTRAYPLAALVDANHGRLVRLLPDLHRYRSALPMDTLLRARRRPLYGELIRDLADQTGQPIDLVRRVYDNELARLAVTARIPTTCCCWPGGVRRTGLRGAPGPTALYDRAHRDVLRKAIADRHPQCGNPKSPVLPVRPFS